MEWLISRNIEQFNGTGYRSWKLRIKSLLEDLEVLSVVDESPPEYPTAEWISKNSVAKCTIVNFLGDPFLHFAAGSSTAKCIIDNLDKLFMKRTLFTQMALRNKLFSLKLLPSCSLLQHFTVFDRLVANLSCAGANLDEMDKICHLLMTLPSTYDEVIESLEVLHEDQYHLAFIKTVLLDHEAKLEIQAITKLKESVNVPNSKRKPNTLSHGPNKRRKPNNYHQNNGNFGSNLYSQMYCDYCGRQNHYIQNCHFYNRPYYNGFHKQNHSNFAPKFKTQPKSSSHPNPLTIKIKEEPVSIKEEPIEIKDEPVWIKQEPAWEQNEPIVIKTEPIDEEQHNVGVTRTTNVNNGPKRKRNRKKRISTKIIAMYVQAEKAAQVHENHQGMPSVQN